MRTPPPVLAPPHTGERVEAYEIDGYRLEPIEFGPEKGKTQLYAHNAHADRWLEAGIFTTHDEAAAYVRSMTDGR